MSVEVVIERRERSDAARHHRHRMRVAPEALIKPAHLLVHHGVAGDTIVEIRLLRRGGKLAVKQEVTGLEEVAVFRQLLDWESAIEQDAFVAVDVGDLRLAASRRGVTGIVGEHPGLGVELADVDDRGANGSLVDRKGVFLVADDELPGFDVGAGLRIHDSSPRLCRPADRTPRWSAGMAASARPRGEAAFCVAHPSVRCKMSHRGSGMRPSAYGLCRDRGGLQPEFQPTHPVYLWSAVPEET